MLLWSWALACSALHVVPRTVTYQRRTTRTHSVCCKEPSDTPPAVPALKPESLTSYHAVGGDHPHGIVLIIYTGGTMGMTKDPGNGALSPEKNYLRQCICAMPEFTNSDMPDTDIIQYEPLLDSSNIGMYPGCNPVC